MVIALDGPHNHGGEHSCVPVSCERRAIKRIASFQVPALKTTNDTNKKKLVKAYKRHVKQVSRNVKEGLTKQRGMLTIFQERKVAGLWRRKLSRFSKMYHSKRILIINSPLSGNTAKKISVKKG